MSENHYDTVEYPYTCGLDGHICTSVQNLAEYMSSEHADFMEQVYSLTGMHGTPQELLDGLENHQQVMEADPVSLLHLLQEAVSVSLIATGFNRKNTVIGGVDENSIDLLKENIASLEEAIPRYPKATELYIHIASNARLLGATRLSADYWLQAAICELQNQTSVFNRSHKVFMAQCFSALGDDENAKNAMKFPNARKKGFLGRIFSSEDDDAKYHVDDWPQRISLSDVIDQPNSDEFEITNCFRAHLATFRSIFGIQNYIFGKIKSGEVDADDIDLDSLHSMDDQLLELQELISYCSNLPIAVNKYWRGHIYLWHGHRMARRSEIEIGLKSASVAYDYLLESEEKLSSSEDDLIDELATTYSQDKRFTTIEALLTTAGLYAESQQIKEASKSYEKAVSRADEFGIEAYAVACLKAAEHYIYLDRNTPKSIDHLVSGIDRLEATGADISSNLEQGDFTLFKMKDLLMFQYESNGEQDNAQHLKSQLEDYQHLNTWRFESGL